MLAADRSENLRATACRTAYHLGMRALVLHGPGDFRYEPSWPAPTPSERSAVIRVEYSGICGSDLDRMCRTGAHRHPVICGHEFMGAVERPATGSCKFAKGEKVAVLPLLPCGKCSACLEKQFFHCTSYNFLGSRMDGGFAEFCLVPEENLLRLPPGVDERIGAFLEPISVALHVVRQSSSREGGNALILGAGPIGLLAGMWLNMLGATEVTMADVREPSLDVARRAGFEKVFHVGEKDFAVQNGFDACIEAAGANAALLQAIQKVRRRGVVVVMGRDTSDTTIPLEHFEMLMRKEITLKGCWGYDNGGEETLIRESLQEFDIGPLVSSEIGLEDGKETISRMYRREMFFCKMLFRV